MQQYVKNGHDHSHGALGALLPDVLLDGDGHMLYQLEQLQPYADTFGLAGAREHPENFKLRQCGLQQL